MIFPTLYRRTATGATQQWNIETVDHLDGHSTIEVNYGQVGGIIQTAITHVRKGKNLGKANETTVSQQACTDAQSKFNKQLDKGYRETLDGESLDSAMSKKPMLAQSYDKHKAKVNFPCYVQPKLDGLRCLAHREQGGVSLYSRMGKPFNSIPHVNQALLHLMNEGEVWDGELYIHGETFQNLSSWVKRAQEDSAKVQYHVYDVVGSGPFDERTCGAFRVLKQSDQNVVIPVSSDEAFGHSDVKEMHDAHVASGYEGAIVRQNDCVYREGYRSSDLLKVKEFLEEEFEVVGASEGKGKFEGMAIFRLVTDQGVEFDCMPMGNDIQRRKYWEERESAIGKFMTVRFFEWTTSEPPCPRFPVGKAFRKVGDS